MKKYILALFCIFKVYGDHSILSKIAFAAGTATGTFTQCAALTQLSELEPFPNHPTYDFHKEKSPLNSSYQFLLSMFAFYSFTTAAYYSIIPFVDLDKAIENNNIRKDEAPLVSFGKGFVSGIQKHPFTGLLKFAESLQGNSRWKSGTIPNETLDSVAGAHQAKKDLEDLVNYLQNPSQFTRLGGKMSKGFLLVGDPGNGKTLLARAVAGEAQCSFLHASGSEFVEMFVGVGAARVRSLFKEARKCAPCIIFIDEIDSLAPKRGSNRSHTETDQTLNQLLVEMDGFNQQSPDKPIIVIGATNRIDILDSAILRPGRFDRQISVPHPNTKERAEILEIYCNKITRSPLLNIEDIAKETINFSGADLANLVNQAALIGATEDSENVTYEHFKKALQLLKSEMTLITNSLARVVPEENFDSVIGAKEAKEELQTIISFLKNPGHYKRLGAKIPRGILLEGNPGNGKTLLARAVAGEAQCSFFKVSGSEFVEKYVGVGASRIRDLFKEARKHAPSIIFIDEIDAIGGERNQSYSSEKDQTLNQLLVEMDGFNQQSDAKPVIIIGATNRVDILDRALLRPGRFDRQIIVPLPDKQTRKEMITLYCGKIKINSSVDFEEIARDTIGYSGAELTNLVNQAALIATNEGCDEVNSTHFIRARELIIFGAVNTSTIMNEEERKIVAFHEAGHALMYLFLENMPNVLHKVTIIPHGRALGMTAYRLEQEKYNYNKKELFAEIQVLLGGRIAEEIQFGIISTGASNDFERATKIAYDMVCKYGMTDNLGTVVYPQNGKQNYSQKTAERIDDEVRSIINKAYQETRALLSANKNKLDRLSMALLEKETLEVEEIYTLLEVTPRSEYKALR